MTTKDRFYFIIFRFWLDDVCGIQNCWWWWWTITGNKCNDKYLYNLNVHVPFNHRVSHITTMDGSNNKKMRKKKKKTVQIKWKCYYVKRVSISIYVTASHVTFAFHPCHNQKLQHNIAKISVPSVLYLHKRRFLFEFIFFFSSSVWIEFIPFWVQRFHFLKLLWENRTFMSDTHTHSIHTHIHIQSENFI